jgi:hypothetical protein
MSRSFVLVITLLGIGFCATIYFGFPDMFSSNPDSQWAALVEEAKSSRQNTSDPDNLFRALNFYQKIDFSSYPEKWLQVLSTKIDLAQLGDAAQHAVEAFVAWEQNNAGLGTKFCHKNPDPYTLRDLALFLLWIAPSDLEHPIHKGIQRLSKLLITDGRGLLDFSISQDLVVFHIAWKASRCLPMGKKHLHHGDNPQELLNVLRNEAVCSDLQLAEHGRMKRQFRNNQLAFLYEIRNQSVPEIVDSYLRLEPTVVFALRSPIYMPKETLESTYRQLKHIDDFMDTYDVENCQPTGKANLGLD